MAGETEPAPAPGGEQQGGDSTPGTQGKYYTDEQLQKIVSGRLREDREALEKQLGLSDLGLKIKDVKEILAAKKAADEASKTELERITGERDQHKTAADAARLEAAKLRALMRAGAHPDKIDALLKRVVGSTPEEIEADVQELASLGLLANIKPEKTGAGSNPPNQTEPAKKTWKKSEIQALLKDPTKTDPEILKDINLAQREGRIDYNS